MWNARFSQPGYVYGTDPNTFLVSAAGRIPPGRVLSLGEGEGRNAVYLASLGYKVHCVDNSDVGLSKAQKLADERGVTISTEVADLAAFAILPGQWDGIVSIFCHLPPEVRQPLYRAVVKGLRPGGVLVLEAYTPQQIANGTGGPKTTDLTLSLADARKDLEGLRFVHAVEMERDVVEGSLHTGRSHVVQIIGVQADERRRGGS